MVLRDVWEKLVIVPGQTCTSVCVCACMYVCGKPKGKKNMSNKKIIKKGENKPGMKEVKER